MTWSLSAMSSCTSTWAPSPGRASRLLPRGRSMNESVRRKCPRPSRFSAKDTLVSDVVPLCNGAATCLQFWNSLQLQYWVSSLWDEGLTLQMLFNHCSWSLPQSQWFCVLLAVSVVYWLSPHYCFACYLFSYSWVLHIPEFLPFTPFWRQAGLFVPTTALQESFPPPGFLLWLCLRLEHAQICKRFICFWCLAAI